MPTTSAHIAARKIKTIMISLTHLGLRNSSAHLVGPNTRSPRNLRVTLMSDCNTSQNTRIRAKMKSAIASGGIVSCPLISDAIAAASANGVS